MMHCYAVLTQEHHAQAMTLGRSDYPDPPNNISRRLNPDGTLMLLEGLWTDEERAWLEANGTVFKTADEALMYLAENKAQWESPDPE